jgi:hypothetical protein
MVEGFVQKDKRAAWGSKALFKTRNCSQVLRGLPPPAAGQCYEINSWLRRL